MRAQQRKQANDLATLKELTRKGWAPDVDQGDYGQSESPRATGNPAPSVNPAAMPVRIQDPGWRGPPVTPIRMADPTGWGNPSNLDQPQGNARMKRIQHEEGYARGGPVIRPNKASTRDYRKGRVE